MNKGSCKRIWKKWKFWFILAFFQKFLKKPFKDKLINLRKNKQSIKKNKDEWSKAKLEFKLKLKSSIREIDIICI